MVIFCGSVRHKMPPAHRLGMILCFRYSNTCCSTGLVCSVQTRQTDKLVLKDLPDNINHRLSDTSCNDEIFNRINGVVKKLCRPVAIQGNYPTVILLRKIPKGRVKIGGEILFCTIQNVNKCKKQRWKALPGSYRKALPGKQ